MAAGLLLIAACGPADDPSGAAEPVAGGASTVVESAVATRAPASSPTGGGDDAPAGSEPTTTTGDASGGTPVEEPVRDPTDAADDGCSTDGSPTEPAANEGDLRATEVRAASADSPLPDLTVRRINCAPGFVNLKNELPADRPLLVWFWAPH